MGQLLGRRVEIQTNIIISRNICTNSNNRNLHYYISQKRHRNLSICVKIREHLGTIYDTRIRTHAKSSFTREFLLSDIHILYCLNVKTRFPLEIENLVPPFARRDNRIRVENSTVQFVLLRDLGLIRSQAQDIIWTRCFPVDTSTLVSDRSLVAHLPRDGTKLTQVFRFNNLWPSCRSFHDPELTREVSSISYVQKQRQQHFPPPQINVRIYIYTHVPSLFLSYLYNNFETNSLSYNLPTRFLIIDSHYD